MKKLIFLLVLCTCTVYSQTYYMNIRMKGGSKTIIPIQDIQKITFSDITSVENRWVNVVKAFTLLQNYPNPFNPSTTIEFQIPRPGNVKIRIYNLSGQLVSSLDRTFSTNGTHSTVWNGRNNGDQLVASGVYFCQVIYGSSMLAKKMLLLK